MKHLPVPDSVQLSTIAKMLGPAILGQSSTWLRLEGTST